MKIKFFGPVTGLLLAALALSACSQRDADGERAANDPTRAVEKLIRSVHDNDLNAFRKLWLPADLRAKIEAKFEAERATLPSSSDADKAQFAQMLGELTADGAEDRLLAEIEPVLAKFEKEVAAQLPMAVAMGSGFAAAAINESDTLNRDQKQHFNAILDALTPWAIKLPLGDREKARAAISALVASARKLELTDLDAVRTLTLDQLLDKAGIVLAGFKQVLAVYGLNLDQSLAGAQVTLLEKTDGKANVKVNYTLLDTPVSFEIAMLERDGHWYSADGIANAEKALATPLQTSTDEETSNDDMGDVAEMEASTADAQARPGE